jgi:hypothetical protein
VGAAGATVPEAVLVSSSQTEIRMRRRMSEGASGVMDINVVSWRVELVVAIWKSMMGGG